MEINWIWSGKTNKKLKYIRLFIYKHFSSRDENDTNKTISLHFPTKTYVRRY